MDKTKYEKGKELEARIFQLELLQKRMMSIIKVDTFSVSVIIDVMGQVSSTRLPFRPNPIDMPMNQEDAEFILQAIPSRIEQLKQEFDNL